ncbi:MAG TPA: DUF2723 domain-containing protein, partial [bacterium]|nr:DUF2723 domain-containing protein [bacterium]
AAATFTALLVYARTLAPGLTEIDSGELSAVAATLGIAHPSGYPLFSVLGRVWTMATPLRVITATNLLSAVLAAASVLLLFRVIRDLLPERAGAARTAGAWTGALAFAFHPGLWSVAVVTEVHALQMFLDAALLHAVVRSGLWGGGAFRERAFLFLGYLAGLCLANHLTSALLLPAVAWGAWKCRRSLRPGVLAGAAAMGLLGLSVYLFLPVRSAQQPLLDWGSPETWEAFRRHVSGAQYRVWIFSSGETIVKNAPQLAAGLLGFTAPLLLLIPPGLMRARKVPGLLTGSVLMAACAAIYPFGYSIHDIATYFLPAYLIVSVWIGLGAARLHEWMSCGRFAALRPALLVLPAVPLVISWRSVDRSGETWVETMARAALETPAPGAVLLNAYWDALHSPAIYLQAVEGVRRDVVLLDQEHFRRSWNVPWLRSHHPELLAGLEAEADRLQELVLRFEREEPYDPAEIQAAFEALLNGILEKAARAGGAYVTQEIEPGVGAPRTRVPEGILFRLENPMNVPPPGGEAPWPELPPPGDGDVYAEQARGYCSRMASVGALRLYQAGDREGARRLLLRAMEWTPGDPGLRANLDMLDAEGPPPAER